MRAFILAALLAVSGIAQPVMAEEATPQAAEMEIRGLRPVEAPWQNESLSLDTRLVQALQIIQVPLSAETRTEWARINRDKRGIVMVVTGEDGKPRLAGRSVMKITYRALLWMPDGGEVVTEAVMAPSGETITVLLPPNVDLSGVHVAILSSRGDYALTLSGELLKLKKKERGTRLAEQMPERFNTSVITSSYLVTRGDGSRLIEDLEAIFSEHAVLNGTFHYSGLPGTFLSSDQERYPSVAALYTREDTVGDRLVTCGNGRIDPLLFTGIGAVLNLGSNLIVALRSHC